MRTIPTLDGLSRLSTRRQMLKASIGGMIGGSMCGWLNQVASATARDDQRKRACVLLWMSGGPSQMDTFDLKSGTENGGPFAEIDTSAPGLRFSEHLPNLARHAHRMAVVRSMSTTEGDHARATEHLRTGYRPGGPVAYPSVGPLVAKELGSPESEIPNCISIAPYRFISPGAFGSGFLGPRHAPLVVADGLIQVQQGPNNPIDNLLKVPNLERPGDVPFEQAESRRDLLLGMERRFAAQRPWPALESRQTAYEKAERMMQSDAVEAFQLDAEGEEIRDKYGRSLFGQGCLVARRLVERGVPFVEVSLNGTGGQSVFGWDTHQDNFNSVERLSTVLDSGWSALMDDLAERGLLESTTILWMGEFGRTPKINSNTGRDHFPKAWTTVLAGGGIAGGRAIGATSSDGHEVVDRPVRVPDLIATLLSALGLDPMAQNMSNVGRPIRLADPEAEVIAECLS